MQHFKYFYFDCYDLFRHWNRNALQVEFSVNWLEMGVNVKTDGSLLITTDHHQFDFNRKSVDLYTKHHVFVTAIWPERFMF